MLLVITGTVNGSSRVRGRYFDARSNPIASVFSLLARLSINGTSVTMKREREREREKERERRLSGSLSRLLSLTLVPLNSKAWPIIGVIGLLVSSLSSLLPTGEMFYTNHLCLS